MPYRSRIEGRTVRLVVAPATYWDRFRSRLGAAVGQAAVVIVAASVVSVALAVGLAGTDQLPFGPRPLFAFILFESILAGPFALGVLFAAPVRALEPSPYELLLPRELTFQEDGIHVVPRHGHPYQTGYGFIPRARLEARGVELSLAHDAPVRVHVSRAAIGPAAFDLIVGWLREHRTL